MNFCDFTFKVSWVCKSEKTVNAGISFFLPREDSQIWLGLIIHTFVCIRTTFWLGVSWLRQACIIPYHGIMKYSYRSIGFTLCFAPLSRITARNEKTDKTEKLKGTYRGDKNELYAHPANHRGIFFPNCISISFIISLLLPLSLLLALFGVGIN